MIGLGEIEAAAVRVCPVVDHTRVFSRASISERLECAATDLVFKPENAQRTGSFKIRGAYNRLCLLSAEERSRGVAAASAGNHAQGVALAARMLGIDATIHMPESASIAKINATEGYGARVVLAGKSFDEAVDACHAECERAGLTYIAAYDDDGIIAGQGTLGLELLADVPDLDTVLIPIGGGGLFAGVARAIRSIRPKARIIGVQAEGADTAARSFAAGNLIAPVSETATICDGIAVKSPSPRTFEYITRLADDVVTVPDWAVVDAIVLLLERAKQVVEPSGAAGLAALIIGSARASGKTAVLLTGGNIDILRLADLAQREMLRADRYLRLSTACSDQPGALAGLLAIVASERGNIITVEHNRLRRTVPLGYTGVDLLVEVRGRAHADRIVTAVAGNGYPTDRTED